MRTQNKKGFTLAELLIVVAILGVLIAVAIPVFTSSLEKARLAVDDANERSVIAMASMYKLTGKIELAGETITPPAGGYTREFFFTTDGTLVEKDGFDHLGEIPDNAYRAQATDPDSSTHKKGAYLIIMVFPKSDTSNQWNAMVLWSSVSAVNAV